MVKNKFALTLTVFLIWIAFFDGDSWINRYQNIQRLHELEEEKEEFLLKIEADKEAIKEIKDPEFLEKFAREEYYMKKDNEEVYIVTEE